MHLSEAQISDHETGSGETGVHLDESLGFQIRHTNRLLQRYLQEQIEPHGITLGMWYFLRVLWQEDGLTQSELSQRVGTMEPTTLVAIKSMVASGFVERRRNAKDGRKLNIFLTKKGKALRDVCVPMAMEVNALAARGLSEEDRSRLMQTLQTLQDNLSLHLDGE